MGLLARVLGLSGLTLGRSPLFLFAKSRRRGAHGTKPHQQPPSAWQASFTFNIPALEKLSSALSNLE
jgi:hypothetical protein